MTDNELKEFMSFNWGENKITPLFVAEVNERFILAAYQGTFSEFDILIKYRQMQEYKWSRIRTPKHIHWAVDILIKMHSDKDKTEQFLDFLIDIWTNTKPIKNEKQRKEILSLEGLLESNKKDINRYEKLGKKGEYSIKFLILLAKLLMVQEKTNLETAYMFKKLLDSLKSGKDIFGIVSIATHR